MKMFFYSCGNVGVISEDRMSNDNRVKIVTI